MKPSKKAKIPVCSGVGVCSVGFGGVYVSIIPVGYGDVF
jgi:hypothetical protein